MLIAPLQPQSQNRFYKWNGNKSTKRSIPFKLTFISWDLILFARNRIASRILNTVLAAVESSVLTFSLVELLWNVGLSSLLSSGLSWAWMHHLLVKSSILISLLYAVLILNTSPSVGKAVGGCTRQHADLHYSSWTTRGEGLFPPPVLYVAL